MSKQKAGVNTLCTHFGSLDDTVYKGAVSPLYMSTSYAFMDVEKNRYPRYFNTPNQESLSKKIAALEHGESALIFSSGMAAISTTLLAFLKTGDHVVMQRDIYGGTRHFIEAHFKDYQIEYTFTEGVEVSDFENAIQANTKLIYIETPSNPLLKLVDIEAIVQLAKTRQVLTAIDNTFASPIVQTPMDFGIDIVLHSATKYLGGHSDISAGVVVASNAHMERVTNLARSLGGNLSEFTVWLLERSIKTLGIRVKAQQRNAKKLAKYLHKHAAIKTVNYPGLKSHPDHELAKKQMNGFGAMLSFELNEGIAAESFMKALQLIKPSMSLAGLESTMILPSTSSHKLLSAEERATQGISYQLIRLSCGIENKHDLIHDIENALAMCGALEEEIKN